MKKIKYLILIVVGIWSITSCGEREIHCNLADFNVAPCGYSFQQIGTLSPNRNGLNFQMIDENIGYAFGLNNGDTAIQLYKTEDGGKTWNNWSVGYNHYPFNMLFVDENNGYISQRGDTLQASMMITNDGGITWTEQEYPDFRFFTKMLKDQYGNLYAITTNSEFTANDKQLLKSIDGGLTWTEIMNSISPSGIFSIKGDRIYLNNIGNKIIISDLDGNFIKDITSYLSNLNHFEIIDSMNIVVGHGSTIYKTSDEGQTWNNIHFQRQGIVIGFTNPENGFMIKNMDYCDIFQKSVISATSDGGDTWTHSEEMDDIGSYFNSAQKVGDNHFLLLLGNDIYELK